MISPKESKQVRMDSWLLKLLPRNMKTETKNKLKNNRKTKAMGNITPTWTTIPEMDRLETPIINLMSC